MFKTIEKKYNNEHYHLYTYQNDEMIITFCDQGAAIVDWQTKNKEGQFETIVLTYQDTHLFLKNPKYLGAMVGPYAGRINPPVININDQTFQLEPNFKDKISLHTGSYGIVFHTYDVLIKDDHTIIFKTKQDEVSSSYPGNRSYELIFEIEGNTLHQTFKTYTDQDTYTNLTNHTYFNLSGNLRRDVLDHKLYIPAKHYGVLDDDFMTISINEVHQTPFDFTQLKPIKEGVVPLKHTAHMGLDHPFVLDDNPILLHDPYSKRTLKVHTDQDCVVVYSHNFLNDVTLYPNTTDRQHLSLCLETQHYPNDLYMQTSPKSYHPKHTYHIQKTSYTITLEDL